MRSSGIDELCGASKISRYAPQYVAPDELSWRVYARDSYLHLWELTLLHSGVCPAFLGFEGYSRLRNLCTGPGAVTRKLLEGKAFKPTKEERLSSNCARAELAVTRGQIEPLVMHPSAPVARCVVAISTYRDWVNRERLKPVGPWPTRQEAVLIDADSTLSVCSARTPLPIRQMAQLTVEVRRLERANGQYPVSAVVARLAVDLFGVPAHQAAMMATFIRPDHAPLGAPKKRTDRARKNG